MLVSSALVRATRKTGRGMALVALAYREATELSRAARKNYPFTEG
jgi:hypothetical protein